MAHHVQHYEYPEANSYTAQPTSEYSFSDTSILHRFPFLKQQAEHINDVVARLFLAELLEKQRADQEKQKSLIHDRLHNIFFGEKAYRPDTPIPDASSSRSPSSRSPSSYSTPFINVRYAYQQDNSDDNDKKNQKENDLVTDIQLPYELHTDHLSDEQEAWLFTHALGAIAFQLDMIDKSMIDFSPDEIEQIADYMRRFFAIDVHVMPVVQANTRRTYAQFKFTRIAPPPTTNTNSPDRMET